jgi:ATP-dependent Clp protease protease subunit
MYIPNVFYKKDGFKDQTSDLFSRLLNLGCIFINGKITDTTATLFLAAAQHIVMDLKLTNITVYINSPGGEYYSGLAIVDIIRFGFENVIFKTKCVGIAASAASLILAAGHHRSIFVHSRVMIHQPLGGISGQATDIAIYSKQIDEAKKLVINLYAKFSNNKSSYKDFEKAIERDNYLTSKESLRMGLVDEIFGNSMDIRDSHNKDIM